MAEIEVEALGGDDYRVEVRDDSGASRHRVTVPPEKLDELGEGASAEELLEESFRFLLEREPRSAILSQFGISTISSYFPEYPEEIRSRLG